MKLLCGDIGGTKTRLAIAHWDPGGTRVLHEEDLPSAGFTDFEALLRAFGPHPPDLDAACFAVAGPVDGRHATVTNLPWRLHADSLASSLGVADCWLLNDLEATAWGIPALAGTDLLELQVGRRDAQGNACVIAAGTGLGEAGMYWDGRTWLPFATEGGHTDFAPTNEEEQALFRFLAARHGHVSWERLVSGMGIVNLYAFLRSFRSGEFPERDSAAEIAQAAEVGCPLATRALDWFVEFYGREAGNLALKTLARGGVFIGGGIAPRQRQRLESGAFIHAFLDKGRMRPLLEGIPVKMILDDRAALLGAARFGGLKTADEGTRTGR